MRKTQLVIVLYLFSCSLALAQVKRPSLQEAIAEADRLDPGWKLADLIAKQPRIANEENSALVLAEIDNDLAKVWKSPATAVKRPPNPTEPTTLDELWLDIRGLLNQPDRKPTERFLRLLNEYEAKFAPIVLRARTLENFKSGRSPIQLKFEPDSTALPQALAARNVSRLLAIDGYIRAIQGDIAGGLQSARAILGAGRSFADEPRMELYLVRCPLQVLAADLIAFVLSQGNATERALNVTQTTLASEADPSQLLMMVRGERAWQYEVCDRVAAGKISFSAFTGDHSEELEPDGIERPEHRASQAIDLHMLTMAVEIAKKSTWEQASLWDKWGRQAAGLRENSGQVPVLAYIQLPVANAIFPAYARARSLVAASETIVGLERLRIARNDWPQPGTSLLPVFPRGLPIDPLSGKPVIWRATGRELLVYTVGDDRKDSGGKLEYIRAYVLGTDLGYRVKKSAKSPKS